MAIQDRPGAPPRRPLRFMTVVRQEAGTRTEKAPEATVDVWPNLLVPEFISAIGLTVMLCVISAVQDAPLLLIADPDVAENPAKAPWYFLGLQEALHYFPPVIAGVLFPTLALLGLMVIPYVDRNPATKPSQRKLAIVLFTFFMMWGTVLTLIGIFFRGPGWSWTWPWKDGVFFAL